MQRYSEALNAFDEGLKIDPTDADIWNVKGESLYKLKRYKEALNSFDEALRIKPDFPLAQTNKTLARQQLNTTSGLP